MTLEIALLFLVILGMVVIMVTERMPTDMLAIALMVVLILGGFVSPQEGIAGLSNKATVTVLALMILTAGLETTGVITRMGKVMKKWLKGAEWKVLLILMLTVGTGSAFISTTAVVIVFTRIIIRLSKDLPVHQKRLLLPISFAGILGGSCTLLGTSTNLLVSSIATDYDLPEFGVFEFSHIGILLFAAGLIYMLFVGKNLLRIPGEEEGDLTEEYNIREYLTEVLVPSNSQLVGKRIEESPFRKEENIDLIEIKRGKGQVFFPQEADSFQAGDVLMLKGGVEDLAELRRVNELRMLSRQSIKDEQRLNTRDMTLCEVFVRPQSSLVGNSLDKATLKREYSAIPLAVRKDRRYYSSRLEEVTIEANDILLMEVARENFKQFYNNPEFVVLQEYEELAMDSRKRYLATGIVLAVILLAALNILPILVSALSGCVAMLLTGCLDLQKAYQRVDWNVFFLLAGFIPLGTAMDNTGASQLIADTFVQLMGDVSPRPLVAVLFISTAIFSAIISNNATAILLAPIAVSIAGELQVDARPLLFTVMFAANMSFMSPIGYQTNALVYGAGNYRFLDFFKAGGLLTLLLWLLVTLLIPWFYF